MKIPKKKRKKQLLCLETSCSNPYVFRGKKPGFSLGNAKKVQSEVLGMLHRGEKTSDHHRRHIKK